MINRKPVIAITGGLASGKSTITSIFASLGHCCVVNSDEISRKITLPGEPAYREIVEVFGRKILSKINFNKDGIPLIDRKILREIVFNSNDKSTENLTKLENIVLPHIDKYTKFLFKRCDADYILWDVPLLYEKELYHQADAVIAIRCDRQTQIIRALRRDETLTLRMVINILNSQASDEQRESIAQYILVNNDRVTLESLTRKVERLDTLIMEGISLINRKEQSKEQRTDNKEIYFFPEYQFKNII